MAVTYSLQSQLCIISRGPDCISFLPLFKLNQPKAFFLVSHTMDDLSVQRDPTMTRYDLDCGLHFNYFASGRHQEPA